MTGGVRCRGCVVGAAAEFGKKHKGCSGRGPTLMLFDSVVVVQQGFGGTDIESSGGGGFLTRRRQCRGKEICQKDERGRPSSFVASLVVGEVVVWQRQDSIPCCRYCDNCHDPGSDLMGSSRACSGGILSLLQLSA